MLANGRSYTGILGFFTQCPPHQHVTIALGWSVLLSPGSPIPDCSRYRMTLESPAVKRNFSALHAAIAGISAPLAG